MIPGLDGLRAIAFLLVFGFHAEYLRFGWVGVQLFFVLSGFLITSILLRMREGLSTRDYFVKFYGRRFLRIFPLYYFYLALMFMVTSVLISLNYKPGVMQIFGKQLPYALSYVYNLHYASASYQHSYFLVHFWSLSVEEQFYIVWPLLIFLTPPRAWKWLFSGAVLLGPLFRVLMVLAYKSALLPTLNELPAMGIYPLTLNHIDAFGLGALITCFRLPKAKLQLAVLSVLLPLIAFGWQFMTSGATTPLTTLGYPFIMPTGYEFVWGYTALNYYFAVLIYAVAREGFLIGILETRVLSYLGRISYGLYVYHNGVIWFTNRIRDLGVGDPWAKPLSTALAFVITLILAALTFKFVEKPFLRLKDRYFPT